MTAPNPDEIDTQEDVFNLLETLYERDITGVRTPDFNTFCIEFDAGDYPAERYTLEINLHAGNIWLHHRTDDGVETVWEKTGRY